MELSGAEIVVRCLQEEGVEYVFGYPGGAVLYIYDELFKQDKVKHVLVRHEQGAVHAADGYSRSTTTVGVALVTSGPGVTNAVTGIATAYMDSIPMVVLTGQVPTHAIGQDAFQECDTVGITRPCVKHNFLVKDVQATSRSTIKKAFYIARTGRPGPGAGRHPEGRDGGATRVRVSAERIACAPTTRSPRATPGQIKKAVQLLLDGRAADGLRRRRRDPGERRADSCTRLVRLLGLSVHQHADGARRVPGDRRAVRRHARACTARTKPTWRCSTATCCSRSARASTTA